MPPSSVALRSLTRAAVATAAAAAAAAVMLSGCSPRRAPDVGELPALPDPVANADTTAHSDTVRVFAVEGELAAISLLPLVPQSDGAPYVDLTYIAPGTDLRDLLDSATAGPAGPADILVSRDPLVLSYARARPDVVIRPLAWDRVHAVVVTDPERSRINASLAFRESLARDVVRADARPADDSYAWSGLTCGAAVQRPRLVQPRIVHREDDATGRDIAERLAALAGRVTAVARDSAALEEALSRGRDAVYVIDLPPVAAVDYACAVLPARAAGSVIVPLVETRAHAIIRDGTPPLDMLGTDPFGVGP